MTAAFKALDAAIPTSARFTPRQLFDFPTSVPRSYYLGHHAKGLAKMRSLLARTSVVLECRDYRIPLTSRNPLLESALMAPELDTRRKRIIVYTKRDLGIDYTREAQMEATKREDLLKRFHAPEEVVFVDAGSGSDSAQRSARKTLKMIKEFAEENFSLTGHRVMVAGMPNVGKSTLLNGLRAVGSGTGKKKVARTGAEAGVTRSVGGVVKIIDGGELHEGDNEHDTRSEGVYVQDTPGVFMPYVSSAESMLKLALCGCVGDGIIPPLSLADYLLFRLNHHSPSTYAPITTSQAPTNDIIELLKEFTQRTGKLSKGGQIDYEATAMRLIHLWRRGKLGHLMLDDVNEKTLQEVRDQDGNDKGGDVSMSQARKLNKQRKLDRMRNVMSEKD